MTEFVTMIRERFFAGDEIRDAGLTTPEDVKRYDDIAYGDDPLQVLDVYRPKAAEGKKLPVIVSVHGGGWVYGDKQRYQYYCMSLAQRGFAVVNYSYRLAPEAKFPAALEDTNTVFHWLLSHGKDYGMDLAHVFAVGDSAGAQILALYCAVCTNPEYAALYSFAAPKGFVPTAVALNCGVYENSVRDSGMLEAMLEGAVTEQKMRQLSPVYFITGAFPPTFLMTCDSDFLKEQPTGMIQQFLHHNVPFEFHFYTGKTKLGHVFHCNMRSEDAQRCNDEECTFFRKYIVNG